MIHFDEIVRNRLERDLGNEPDDARVTVRVGDLRGALAAADAAEDEIEAIQKEADDRIAELEKEHTSALADKDDEIDRLMDERRDLQLRIKEAWLKLGEGKAA